MLADESIPWRTVSVEGAGQVHTLTYKSLPQVLWRSGTRDRVMRLFVLNPIRYRPRVGAMLRYRKPAYLITTDLGTPDPDLLQAYVGRSRSTTGTRGTCWELGRRRFGPTERHGEFRSFRSRCAPCCCWLHWPRSDPSAPRRTRRSRSRAGCRARARRRWMSWPREELLEVAIATVSDSEVGPQPWRSAPQGVRDP